MNKCCCDPFKIHKKKVLASIRDCVITKVFILCHSNVSLENWKKEQLKNSDTTKVNSVVRKKLELISVVPLPETTTDVVSVFFSCSSSEVLDNALFNLHLGSISNCGAFCVPNFTGCISMPQ